MPFRILLLAVFGLVALLARDCAAKTPDMLNELISHSPFATAGTKSVTTVSNDQPLEFRAVLEERGSKIFSIFEVGTHRSAWVDLNSTQNSFSVKAYDEEHASVTVEYQGRELTLPLKRATTVARALSPNPAGSVQPLNAAAVSPASIDPMKAQLVQKEIERRHALTRANYAPPGTPNAISQP